MRAIQNSIGSLFGGALNDMIQFVLISLVVGCEGVGYPNGATWCHYFGSQSLGTILGNPAV